MTNGYKCFYNGKDIDIYADSMYGAQQLATVEFQKTAGRKKVKEYQVNVVLCELNGKQYAHSGEIPC